MDLRDFPGDPVQEKIVHDYEVIINDPEIKVVVEVMGGTNPAYSFVKRALESGKSVCTSNKELVAKHGTELLAIAREKNVNFLFEASCGGGIPIIRPLNTSLTADDIDERLVVCPKCGEEIELAFECDCEDDDCDCDDDDCDCGCGHED